MKNLNTYLISYIFSFLPDNECNKCTLLNKHFHNCINSDRFWRIRASMIYGPSMIKVSVEKGKYKQLYFDIEKVLDFDGDRLMHKKHLYPFTYTDAFWYHRCMKILPLLYDKDLQKILSEYNGRMADLFLKLKDNTFDKISLAQMSYGGAISQTHKDEIKYYYLHGHVKNTNIARYSKKPNKYIKFLSKLKYDFIGNYADFVGGMQDNKSQRLFHNILNNLGKKEVSNYFAIHYKKHLNSWKGKIILDFMNYEDIFNFMKIYSCPWKILNNLSESKLKELFENINNIVHSFVFCGLNYKRDWLLYNSNVRKKIFDYCFNLQCYDHIYNIYNGTNINSLSGFKQYTQLFDSLDICKINFKDKRLTDLLLNTYPDIFEKQYIIDELIINKKYDVLDILIIEGFDITPSAKISQLLLYDTYSDMSQFLQFHNIVCPTNI